MTVCNFFSNHACSQIQDASEHLILCNQTDFVILLAVLASSTFSHDTAPGAPTPRHPHCIAVLSDFAQGGFHI